MAKRFDKDSGARLDYGIDYYSFLERGETIADSVWSVEVHRNKNGVSGPMLSVDSEYRGATFCNVWLTSGTPGVTYAVINKVSTSGGKTDRRSFLIDVVAR